MKCFPELFSPHPIGSLLVKNRIVMAPMLVAFGNSDGSVSDTAADYYTARARGGVGLIIVEASCVDSQAGRESSAQLNIDHPRYIQGLERLSASIKAHGARAFIQLFHAGRQTSRAIIGRQPVAPSAIPYGMSGEIPRQLSEGEIQEIEQKFIQAAHYAYQAGFEGVELHAAHGYLLNQFLSANSNQRLDQYGGDLPNRMRILLNIITGIKKDLPDLALSVRLNIDDFVPGGLILAETGRISQELEKAGADLINCSCGTYASGLTSIEPSSYPEGWRMYLAEAIKKLVNIPVCGGGMISSPVYANQAVKEGSCDFIFLGRSLLADAEWANKAGANQAEDIRPCIRCNNCISSNFRGVTVSCTVNPHVGRERQYDYHVPRVKKKSRVAVVGSGPAGLQAALSLDKLGLEVTLFEKEARAGGLMNLAAIPPYKEKAGLWRDHMVRELNRHSVEIRYQHLFNSEDALQLAPDYIVLATGSVPYRPAIEGIDDPCCIGIEEVLSGRIPIQSQSVAIIGGGRSGCETADYLLEGDNRITIIEPRSRLCDGMEKKNRRDLMNRLDQGGVVKKLGFSAVKIADHRVWLSSGPEPLSADYIILAAGYKPYNELYFDLQSLQIPVYLIGDALRVRGFKSAILEGEMTAHGIMRDVRSHA